MNFLICIFLKSRKFTERVWEAISQIGVVYYEIILKYYGQLGQIVEYLFTN